MKRHAALLHHSREHHHALKLARLASFAAASGSPEAIAQAAQTITEEFSDKLDPHFQEEESGLLQQMAAIGQHELVHRTMEDHRRLRALNLALSNPTPENLGEFASLLHDHVRFEERELFEIAQKLLYPDD